MARTRTFIAVEISEPVRQRAAALQQKLARTTPGVKWVEEANLHITLLFLGEVDNLDLVPICRIVKQQAAKLPPFTFEVSGLGVFPSVRRPKVLWAGIRDGGDELKTLHENLEGPLLELGSYRREERAFSPHLTLGRLDSEVREGAWTPILTEHEEWTAGFSQVTQILVMSSDLRRAGPTYNVVGRAPLED